MPLNRPLAYAKWLSYGSLSRVTLHCDTRITNCDLGAARVIIGSITQLLRIIFISAQQQTQKKVKLTVVRCDEK